MHYAVCGRSYRLLGNKSIRQTMRLINATLIGREERKRQRREGEERELGEEETGHGIIGHCYFSGVKQIT